MRRLKHDEALAVILLAPFLICCVCLILFTLDFTFRAMIPWLPPGVGAVLFCLIAYALCWAVWVLMRTDDE